MPSSSSLRRAVARRALIADIATDRKGWLKHGIAALAISVRFEPGHARITAAARVALRRVLAMLQKHPERVIEKAVYGMLPKTALGRQVLRRKLRVYANADHPHVAQQPTPLTLKHAGEK